MPFIPGLAAAGTALAGIGGGAAAGAAGGSTFASILGLLGTGLGVGGAILDDDPKRHVFKLPPEAGGGRIDENIARLLNNALAAELQAAIGRAGETNRVKFDVPKVSTTQTQQQRLILPASGGSMIAGGVPGLNLTGGAASVPGFNLTGGASPTSSAPGALGAGPAPLPITPPLASPPGGVGDGVAQATESTQKIREDVLRLMQNLMQEGRLV